MGLMYTNRESVMVKKIRVTFDKELWLPYLSAIWWEGHCPTCREEMPMGTPAWKDPNLTEQGEFPWVCGDCALNVSPKQ